MRVEVNGETIETTAQTLRSLIDERGFEIACVATAVDGEFVPRTKWDDTKLANGAKIEVVSPMQGG